MISIRYHIVLPPPLRFRLPLDEDPTAFPRQRYQQTRRGAALDIPPVRSNPTHEKQNDEDNQDDADDTDAAVTIAVPVATETAAEAAKQEDDEDDDEY